MGYIVDHHRLERFFTPTEKEFYHNRARPPFLGPGYGYIHPQEAVDQVQRLIDTMSRPSSGCVPPSNPGDWLHWELKKRIWQRYPSR